MGVYLDLAESTSRGLAPAEVRNRVADKLRSVPFVADAMTADELSASPATSDRPYLELYRHSFSADRSPDVMLRPKEYALTRWKTCGTSHGTPYRFDTHIPMVFFGAGVPAGLRTERVHTTDLAPTLAGLLGAAPPADVDGVSRFGFQRHRTRPASPRLRP